MINEYSFYPEVVFHGVINQSMDEALESRSAVHTYLAESGKYTLKNIRNACYGI